MLGFSRENLDHSILLLSAFVNANVMEVRRRTPLRCKWPNWQTFVHKYVDSWFGHHFKWYLSTNKQTLRLQTSVTAMGIKFVAKKWMLGYLLGTWWLCHRRLKRWNQWGEFMIWGISCHNMMLSKNVLKVVGDSCFFASQIYKFSTMIIQLCQ